METIILENDGGHRTPESIKEECNSSSSSSIGEDSDLDREDDVEIRYNGSFDDAVEALEQAIPIRRGISKYYNGKSKSFTSLLPDSTSSSTIQDIAKPENAYTRKRRAAAFKLSKFKTKKKPKNYYYHAISNQNTNILLHG